MTTLKRLPLKYVRDYIKKHYKIRDCCYICGTTENLELHHLYSVSELFNNWCSSQNITSIDSEEQMLELRVAFAEQCSAELDSANTYTLCGTHHKRLHNLYGQRYPNYLVPKIKNWLEIQKDKNGK